MPIWSVNLTDDEAPVFQRMVDARGVTRSSAMREALRLLRAADAHAGDLDAWVDHLLGGHGPFAEVRLDFDGGEVVATIDGACAERLVGELIATEGGAELWLRDPESRLEMLAAQVGPMLRGSITFPLAEIQRLRARSEDAR